MEVLNFSHIGSRNYQEDSYYIHRENNLFIVCDGVGGSANGAKASQSVIQSIVSEFERYDHNLNSHRIKKIIKNAHEDLLGISEGANIATTIALLYIDGDVGYTAHLGDSKIYHIRSLENYYWYTKDHSLVQELYDAGVLTNEEQVRQHPMRNRITKAVSTIQESQNPTIHKLEKIKVGDIFLVCSDGVIESFDNRQIFELFKNDSIYKSWDILSETCKINSKDNNTCILINI